MTEREHEHDAESEVEDLDVPESEGEDVKGGALNAYQKDNLAIKGELKLGGNIGQKFNPSGLDGGGIK
jgi:hypothetical protein